MKIKANLNKRICLNNLKHKFHVPYCVGFLESIMPLIYLLIRCVIVGLLVVFRSNEEVKRLKNKQQKNLKISKGVFVKMRNETNAK